VAARRIEGIFRLNGIERFLACAVALAGTALAAPPAPGPQLVGLRIGPIVAEKVGVALLVAPSAVGKCAGQFRGNLTFFNVAPGAQVAGTFSQGSEGCELPASIPWTALPVEVVQGARGDVVTVRFRGERIEGKKARKVDWGATIPRTAVQLTEPGKATLRRFASATDLTLGPLGLNTTTLNAEIAVRSPLHFHLRVMEVRTELEVDGKVVASGLKQNFLIFGGRPNRITFPVTVDNRAMLSAAGSSLAKGAKVEGRLTGVARIRFPAGDIDYPVEFPILLSLR
jgi:hypothetical protein